MRERELKKRLKRTLQIPVGCESEEMAGHLEKTRRLVRLADSRYRKRSERIGFFQFLLRQAKFTGKRIWIVQAVLTLVYLAVCLPETGFQPWMEMRDIVNRHAGFLLCSFAVVLSLAGYLVLQRSVRYKMYETETSAYFSGKGLFAANMLLMLAGAVPVLAAVFITFLFRTDLGGYHAALYLAVPFLAAFNGGMFLFTRFREKCAAILKAGLPAALVSLYLCDLYVPAIYSPGNKTGWLIAGVLMVFAGAVQWILLFKKERIGERKWSLQ